jgi:TRAP-type C4-dicarboxylate transport system permease small subunit
VAGSARLEIAIISKGVFSMTSDENGKRQRRRALLHFAAGFASYEKCNERINIFSLALLFLMMVLIVTDLFGRSLFKPVPGTLESTEIIMVFLIFLSLAYTEIKGMHVRAQTVVIRFPKRVQILLDIAASTLGSAYFSFMACGGTLTALESLKARQVSETAEIPIYPAKFAIPVGCVLIVIVFLKDIIIKVRLLRRKEP